MCGAQAGPGVKRHPGDAAIIAGLLLLGVHFLLGSEDGAPILVLGHRHTAFNAYTDPLGRHLGSKQLLEDGHSFRIRKTGQIGSGLASR